MTAMRRDEDMRRGARRSRPVLGVLFVFAFVATIAVGCRPLSPPPQRVGDREPTAVASSAQIESAPNGEAAPAPVASIQADRVALSAPNPWSDLTRDVLSPRCGRCHRGDLPTAVPGALAIFDLTEEPWYARLHDEQFDGLLRRIRGSEDLPASDAEAVEKFVRCAREHDCRPG